MASFRDTMRLCLLNYPSIFPTPLDVVIHLFSVIGNGCEWVNGELVEGCGVSRKKEVMDFSDLDEELERIREQEREESEAAMAYLSPLREARKLRNQAERMRRSFVADNMETILDCACTEVYFGNQPASESYVTRSICIRYARAFSFPDDIKPDWAEALMKYLTWWRTALNRTFGVGRDPEDVSFWPQDAQEARQAIQAAIVRLWPAANHGETHEAYMARMKEFMADLKIQERAFTGEPN